MSCHVMSQCLLIQLHCRLWIDWGAAFAMRIAPLVLAPLFPFSQSCVYPDSCSAPAIEYPKPTFLILIKHSSAD